MEKTHQDAGRKAVHLCLVSMLGNPARLHLPQPQVLR